MSSHHDLVVGDARLRDRSGRYVIAVDDGRITAIDTVTRSGRVEIDAAGGLVTESFVDPHLHLCKAHTLDVAGEAALTAYTAGGMGAAMVAIEAASAVKRGYTDEDVYRRANRVLVEGLRHGVLHVQAFADVDTTAGLRGVRPLLRLRDDWRELLAVAVVAFPQDGLLRDEGAESLVEQAVVAGADVVGGIPWIELTDADAAEQVRRLCALAARTGRRVAMLTDDAGDASLRTTELLAQQMLAHGLAGRGVACHARAMAVWPEPYVRRLTGLARKVGLGFVTDPHTGPLALRAFDLLEAGVPVALGQDDVVDAYYPFGRHNMLEVAFLAAHLLDARTGTALERIYDMVTTLGAQAMGVLDHRLVVGAPANLVVLGQATIRDALAAHEPPRYVISRGVLVAETSQATTWHGPATAAAASRA